MPPGYPSGTDESWTLSLVALIFQKVTKMLFPILMILTDDANSFWVKFLVAFLLITGLYFLFRFGLRRFKYSKKDLKAAGLNHQQRREWLATRKMRLVER